MRPDEIVRRLNLARIEAGQLITAPGRVTTVDSPEFISWSMRVGSLLIHSLGSNHHITKRFLHNQRLLPPPPKATTSNRTTQMNSTKVSSWHELFFTGR